MLYVCCGGRQYKCLCVRSGFVLYNIVNVLINCKFKHESVNYFRRICSIISKMTKVHLSGISFWNFRNMPNFRTRLFPWKSELNEVYLFQQKQQNNTWSFSFFRVKMFKVIRRISRNYGIIDLFYGNLILAGTKIYIWD